MPRAKVVKDVDAPVLNEEQSTEPEEEATQEPEEEQEQAFEEEYDSYKMDPKKEVWPGGPNFGMINKWKDEYGDIYVTEYSPAKYCVWRTLGRHEYRRLVKNLEQSLSSGVSQAEANMNNEETITEMCMLFPRYTRTVESMAGLASTIAQQVMEASAFVSLEVRQL